jgi:hypothetical protein
MRKTALVIAGAIAFDLGVLVVSSHAATDPVITTRPHKPFVALKSFKFMKFDAVNTPQSCTTKQGTPTTQGGVKGCLLPADDANSAMQDVSTTR